MQGELFERKEFVVFLKNLQWEEKQIDKNLREIDADIEKVKVKCYYSIHISGSGFDSIHVTGGEISDPTYQTIARAEMKRLEVRGQLEYERNIWMQKKERCRRVKRCVRDLAYKDQHCIEKIFFEGVKRESYMEQYRLSEDRYKRLYSGAVNELMERYNECTKEMGL